MKHFPRTRPGYWMERAKTAERMVPFILLAGVIIGVAAAYGLASVV